MRLFVAEKPSVGRAIAAVLPKPQQKGEGFIRAANGDVVSWCIGHLLEQVEPDAYDPVYKQWRLDHLPIVPEQWQLQAKPKTRKQLSVLRKLVKEADQLVHAGDPDREGQLLVDEVFDFLKVSKTRKQQIQRCLISDLNPNAVKKALNSLRPNSDFTALSVSALARSRADWLYGINLTRAFSIKGRQAGVNSVLSVGRVQTPILGLVVRRDQEISNFVSRPFYDVFAQLALDAQQSVSFQAKWIPSDACASHQDEEGRVLNLKLADNVAQRIQQQPAVVETIQRKGKKQFAPLPYNLSALQIDAAKALGMSAKQVLDVCQSLYEKYQLITYPRSDCRYLPKEHLSDISSVSSAIRSNSSELASVVANADFALRSKAWNDAKVDAHHAIIPTTKQTSLEKLGKWEQGVYRLIARQYLLQFYPAFEYADTKVGIRIAGGLFRANARETLKPGWKQAMPQKASDKQNTSGEDCYNQSQLPPLTQGQQLWCHEGRIVHKQTQPPVHFTDATLLAAMTGINRFVSDKELQKVLKETDGLGTEATRASIIELLFTRQFLRREGKQIRATELGQALIRVLPQSTTLPDRTALWEQQLNGISERQLNYQSFMQPLEQELRSLVNEARGLDTQRLSGIPIGKSGFRGKKSAGVKSTTCYKRKRRKATQKSSRRAPSE